MEDRTVSLNAVIDVMNEMWGDSGELLDAIKELPPVTPKTGHWILLAHELYACSKCHSKWTRKLNYCPYCGADMRADREESKHDKI